MGELINTSEFSGHTDAFRNQTRFATRKFEWYFPKSIEDVNERYQRSLNWDKTIRVVYPEMVAIHLTRLDDALRVRIRRNIRDQCVGDVIYLYMQMNYESLHRYTSDHDGRNRAYRNKIDHGYWKFYFETAGDATQFALLFGDFISEIGPRHPDKEEDEEAIADAAANPHGIYEERY